MGFDNRIKNNLPILGFTFLLIGIGALVPFTNCSQNPQNSSTPQTAFLNPIQKFEVLKAEFKGRVPLSFCRSNEAYGCMKKVYSAEILDGQILPNQECAFVSAGLKLCPVIQTFHFNTESAQKNCNDCQETYEYLEYSCHLKVPNEKNVYPITFSEPTLEQSLLDLYQFCALIAEEPQ